MAYSLPPTEDTATESLTSSVLTTVDFQWLTAPAYKRSGLMVVPPAFQSVTDTLLENPNLNSTHLFRADILYDSTGELQTPVEKEQSRGMCFTIDNEASPQKGTSQRRITGQHPPDFRYFTLKRTVVRRLIPRKPQLDQAVDQTCHIYESKRTSESGRYRERHLVVYFPHVAKEEDMPWYHPPIKALAYLYHSSSSSGHRHPATAASLSIHILPYSKLPPILPQRFHRTLLSLLDTYIRLVKPSSSSAPRIPLQSLAPGDLKDTIIPQHLVQNTYTRLKETYATNLIARWVEKTEPAKHVFEDLSIAAFLIELWKQMYGTLPSPEGKGRASDIPSFPGFVDVACGNGVLVYVLLQEGYNGFGFDARKRRTWSLFPESIQGKLEEKILIPHPFLDVLMGLKDDVLDHGYFHYGFFNPGTFMISNHADELTPWTPILAALSNPEAPLPWLAIPCCSHALSGARHRYPPPKALSQNVEEKEFEEQLMTGDLKALRATKPKAAGDGDTRSMYGSLTSKIVAIAEELGFDVEKTLMRIPSTRNIGLIGGRKTGALRHTQSRHRDYDGTAADGQKTSFPHQRKELEGRIDQLVDRECRISGGVEAAAKIWLEKAQSLQLTKGRGKVNEKAHLRH